MASFDTDWDVDKYYSAHEPKHHWELRKRFMESNKDRYPEERIVCLGQTFANIEFMGCRYPKPVMDLVEDLAFGVVQDFREDQKKRLKRTFVSGSDAAGAKVNRGCKRKSETAISDEVPSKRFLSSAPNFVRASQSSNDPTKPNTVILDESDPLSSFIVVLLDWHPDEHPCNVLNRSAGFCRISCAWEFQGQTCSIKVGNTLVSTAQAALKNEARDEAASKALEVLATRCYSVRVRNKFLSDGSVVDSGDLDSSAEKGGQERLGAENVGHKLLKLMGWSGGGLGKGGAGISEPITASAIANREGFGSKSAGKDFKQKVRKIVEEYAASCNPYDLVFTTGFSNDQRKEMHMIAKRLGLKSKSFGKEDERFITISRKTSGRQLLQELISRGGSNEKYTLVPPKK